MSECPDTEAVFRTHDLAFDVILCKPDAGPSDKNPRFEAVAKGTTHAGLPLLEIVAFVGDNIYDFPAQSQAIRPLECPACGSPLELEEGPLYDSRLLLCPGRDS